MNRIPNSEEERAIRDFEALKAYLNNSQFGDQAEGIASILFKPNENLETLISNLVETEGRNFDEFVHRHRVIVNYFNELDKFIQITPRFSIEYITLLETNHRLQTTRNQFETDLTEMLDKHKKLKSAREYLEGVLPAIHSRLFYSISCPDEVYSLGRRYLADSTLRSSVQNEAQSLVAKFVQQDNLLQKMKEGNLLQDMDMKGALINVPDSDVLMNEGVYNYLKLSWIAVYVDKGIENTEKMCKDLTLKLKNIRILTKDEKEDVCAFVQDRHPIYNTGTYAGYMHVLTPKIILKLAHEFASEGGKISFDVRLK